MHALGDKYLSKKTWNLSGLEHEHQRPDRDRYIEIQWENVEPGKESALLTAF